MNYGTIISTIKSSYQSVNSFLNNDLLALFQSKITTPLLTDITNLDRPAVTFRWVVQMPSTLFPYSKNNLKEEIGTLPSNYVESCQLSLPIFSSVADESYYFDRSRINVAKFPDNGILNLTFYEDENYTTTKYLLNWSNVCYNRVTGYFKPLKARVGKINLCAFGIEDNDLKLCASMYVIPHNSSSLDLNFNGESDRQKITVSFSLLYWDIKTAKDFNPDGNGGYTILDGNNIDDIISKIIKYKS